MMTSLDMHGFSVSMIEVDEAEARLKAHAVFGLLNSTPHSGRLPDPQMHDVLRDMAHGALGLA